MSLRLTAYLRSIRPNYVILGHTGAFPQKVEALGAVLRDGGDRVAKICEVNGEGEEEVEETVRVNLRLICG